MILGIGIDTIEIRRFFLWHTKTEKALSRIFSKEEITYCLSNTKLAPQRFAVRFSAREAFLKALSSALTYKNRQVALLAVCKAVSVQKTDFGTPYLTVNWQHLPHFPEKIQNMRWHLSLSHTDFYATAIVIGEL